MTPPGALIKSWLPRGLLGRSLLILVTPLIVLQLVSAYVFYGTHWDLVTRRLALEPGRRHQRGDLADGRLSRR